MRGVIACDGRDNPYGVAVILTALVKMEIQSRQC